MLNLLQCLKLHPSKPLKVMHSLIDMLIHSKFIQLALCGNVWIWFHILAAALGTRLFLLKFSQKVTMLIVSAIVLLWEVYEVVVGGELAQTYGSLERYFYDTAGDIIAAMVVSIIVVSVLWGNNDRLDK